jgi:hypothetical protein
VNEWWRANAAAGRASVLFGYAFGKAQRILASVDDSIGPIVVHGAVDTLNRGYRECGVRLPETRMVTDFEAKKDFAGALVVAPPSAQSSPWLKRFGDYSDAFASGWMQIRGARRRRAVDKGFVLSDHADWPSLNRAIEATGAERVFVTHGHMAPLVQWLNEHGIEAHAMKTSSRARRARRRRALEAVREALRGDRLVHQHQGQDDRRSRSTFAAAQPHGCRVGRVVPHRTPARQASRRAHGCVGRRDGEAAAVALRGIVRRGRRPRRDISLILPPPARESDLPLSVWIEERLIPLRELGENEQRARLESYWCELDGTERFVFNKLITGAFRVGVSALLVIRAILAGLRGGHEGDRAPSHGRLVAERAAMDESRDGGVHRDRPLESLIRSSSRIRWKPIPRRWGRAKSGSRNGSGTASARSSSGAGT